MTFAARTTTQREMKEYLFNSRAWRGPMVQPGRLPTLPTDFSTNGSGRRLLHGKAGGRHASDQHGKSGPGGINGQRRCLFAWGILREASHFTLATWHLI